jgi:hypothetical protein
MKAIPASMTCAQVKPISGRPPLVCALAAGHDGLHAALNDCGAAIARWPVLWTAADQARLEARHGWHKPHVRRAYQTLAMWKAAHS